MHRATAVTINVLVICDEAWSLSDALVPVDDLVIQAGFEAIADRRRDIV